MSINRNSWRNKSHQPRSVWNWRQKVFFFFFIFGPNLKCRSHWTVIFVCVRKSRIESGFSSSYNLKNNSDFIIGFFFEFFSFCRLPKTLAIFTFLSFILVLKIQPSKYSRALNHSFEVMCSVFFFPPSNFAEITSLNWIRLSLTGGFSNWWTSFFVVVVQ